MGTKRLLEESGCSLGVLPTGSWPQLPSLPITLRKAMTGTKKETILLEVTQQPHWN